MWTEQITPQGRKFYFNSITRISQWEKPESLNETSSNSSSDWIAYSNADGRTYWYNKNTKETTWKAPKEQSKNQKISTPTNNSDKEHSKNESDFNDSKNITNIKDSGSNINNDHSKEEAQSSPVGQNTALNGQNTLSCTISYPNNIQKQPVSSFKPHLPNANYAEQAFIQLLADCNVDQSWEWERVLRATVAHAAYRAIEGMPRRKRLWLAYLDLRKNWQREQQNHIQQNEMKDKFFQLMEKYFAQGKIPIHHANEIGFNANSLDRLLCASFGEFKSFEENMRLSWLEEWNESLQSPK